MRRRRRRRRMKKIRFESRSSPSSPLLSTPDRPIPSHLTSPYLTSPRLTPPLRLSSYHARRVPKSINLMDLSSYLMYHVPPTPPSLPSPPLTDLSQLFVTVFLANHKRRLLNAFVAQRMHLGAVCPV